MKAVHLLIDGKVQGVYYRASAMDFAEQNGVCGWIRNTREGKVEAVAQGPEAAVNAFISWCEKGPSGARVSGVEVKAVDLGPYADFRIVR